MQVSDEMIPHRILNVLLTHKQIVIASIAALVMRMYAMPLDELTGALGAPGVGAKPAKPPDDGDGNGDYGHTVKPAKPAKPNN